MKNLIVWGTLAVLVLPLWIPVLLVLLAVDLAVFARKELLWFVGEGRYER